MVARCAVYVQRPPAGADASKRSRGDGSPRPRRRASNADEKRCEHRRLRDRPDEAREETGSSGGAESLPAERARHPETEEHVSQQVERRAGGNDHDLSVGEDVGGVRDHELVTHGREDDARDKDDMEVDVRVARKLYAVGAKSRPSSMRTPGIREAVAVAVPDELLGNRIRAVVVPSGSELLAERDVRRYWATRLPRYMIPAEVEFRSRLPRTATEKVDRTLLVAEATGSRHG
jgi:AMP-binding enzyme C-terminal domain